MELTHPLDAALRARLKVADVHQSQFAKAIGRSPSWLNKYMNGAGNATLDDVVRMVALLIGVDLGNTAQTDRIALLRKMLEDALASL